MIQEGLKRIIVSALIVFLGFTVIGCDFFRADPYHITVQVLDFDGNPMEGMKVTYDRTKEMGKTDSDGLTSLTDLRGSGEIKVIDPDLEIGFPGKRVTPDDEGSTITIQAKYHLYWAKIEGKIIIPEPQGVHIRYSVNAIDGHPDFDGSDTIESLGSDQGIYGTADGENFSIDVKIKEEHPADQENPYVTIYVIGQAIDRDGENYVRGMYGVSNPHDFASAKTITLEDGDIYSGIEFQLFPLED